MSNILLFYKMEINPNNLAGETLSVTSHVRIEHSVEYTQKQKVIVKRLCIVQSIWALLSFTSHSSIIMLKISRQRNYSDICLLVSALMVVAAGIGLASSKKNKKPLIITHLVLNAILMPLCWLMVSYTSVSINVVAQLMSKDSEFDWYEGWFILDIILVAASFLMFVISLSLLVYNSIATCGNHQQQNQTATIVFQTAPNSISNQTSDVYLSCNLTLRMTPSISSTSASEIGSDLEAGFHDQIPPLYSAEDMHVPQKQSLDSVNTEEEYIVS